MIIGKIRFIDINMRDIIEFIMSKTGYKWSKLRDNWQENDSNPFNGHKLPKIALNLPFV